MTRSLLTILLLPIGIFILWGMLSGLNLVDPLFLPTPWSVIWALVAEIADGTLFYDLVATVRRSLVGFALAAMIGVPLGLLIGRISFLDKATQPTIDFFRSIPATALFPLFLYFFGLGDAAKIAIVIYACSLIVLVNTAYGALQIKAARLQAAKVMGATRWDMFWSIVVPESSPGIFAGLRISLSMSFVLIIVTEMFIGTTVGLGYFIVNSQIVYHIPEMYAGIMTAGAVGYIFNSCLLIVEKRVLHWSGK